jgi:hypothetical protein
MLISVYDGSGSIVNRAAAQLWRKGVPHRLRAYVWKRTIGNKLGLTQENFDSFVKHNSDFIEDKVTVTIIEEQEETADGAPPPAPPQVHYAPSELVFGDDDPEFVLLHDIFWGTSSPATKHSSSKRRSRSKLFADRMYVPLSRHCACYIPLSWHSM